MDFTGIYSESVGSGIATDIGLFASGIYENLGNPSNTSVAFISGWLGSNIGQLNISIESAYTSIPASGIILPALGVDEVSVYEQMFNQKFYTQAANSNLGASAYDWSEITEEGSTVRRVSKNEIAKTYLSLAKESKDQVIKLTHLYRKNKAKPVSVTGNDDVFLYSAWNSNLMVVDYPYSRFYHY